MSAAWTASPKANNNSANHGMAAQEHLRRHFCLQPVKLITEVVHSLVLAWLPTREGWLMHPKKGKLQ
jgi:hypothetical protein